MRSRAVLLLFLSVTPAITRAQAQAPPPCEADSTYHALDFWMGTWRVTVNGVFDGTDVVEKILDGCAITESWHDSTGFDGRSLFFVAHVGGYARWKQVWVTGHARAIGGTKEKVALMRYADGGVRFQGELVGPLGRVLLDRTTLTPQHDGTVRQVIEQSNDGGTTWQQSYIATYTRVKP